MVQSQENLDAEKAEKLVKIYRLCRAEEDNPLEFTKTKRALALQPVFEEIYCLVLHPFATTQACLHHLAKILKSQQ